MAASRKPRPKERRSVDNELYQRRAAAAGIVMVSVRVPSVRVPEIKAIALEWRREAKLLLGEKRPAVGRSDPADPRLFVTRSI